MREKEISEKQQHDPKHIKMAIGIASDPRHKGGDYTGAHNKIEKIAKGLASHPQVAAVLKKQNEAIKEGLGELADRAERDHEVQMARAELYKIAKYAIKLHEILKGVSEEQGLEGWVQKKITKSSDYISSVYHHLDYKQATGEINDSRGSVDELEEATDLSKASTDKLQSMWDSHKDEERPSPALAAQLKRISAELAQRKAMHANKKKTESLQDRLAVKLAEKAVSKSQQQAAGIALAAKRKGETPKGKGAAADMAKMSTKELEKFAGTKHKGLPEKK